MWHHGIVVNTTGQPHLAKPELRVWAGSNPALGLLEICLGIFYRDKACVRYGQKRPLFSNFRAIATWSPPQNVNLKLKMVWENGQKKSKRNVCDGENLWQWHWLVLAFRRLAIPQKPFRKNNSSSLLILFFMKRGKI